MNHIFRVLIFVFFSVSLLRKTSQTHLILVLVLVNYKVFLRLPQSAMGGVGIASYDPLSINVNNPSLTLLFFLSVSQCKLEQYIQPNFYKQVHKINLLIPTNFNYLMFAFPLTKFWGTSFGLLPFFRKCLIHSLMLVIIPLQIFCLKVMEV